VEEAGYVIRCVDAFTGRVLYRGKKEVLSYKKDAIRMKDTYSLTGARKTKTALERRYQDSFYSIERLSCCYIRHEIVECADRKTERMIKGIEEAMRRLDELCDKNNFDRGDKMRINVVRKTLKSIAENLLDEG
jgi:hypothetical protein